MSGKVNFRDDGHVALGSISYNFATLLLGIYEGAIMLAVILATITADNCLVALSCYSRELGVFLNLDTPSLVVGQVPVEAVDVVQSQDIHKTLDRVNTEIVA